MAGQAEPKNVQVQIYLLNERVREPRSAVRASEEGSPLIRELSPPLEGIPVTRRSRRKRPDWAPFLEAAVGEPLLELENASASALLLLRAEDRVFALTYGHGRSLIDPSVIERRFGLRVALNAIDPQQLRAVDSRTVEEMTFHTKRQASRISEVSSFGLDTARDLIRGITGVPREGFRATRISGAESVTLSAAIDVAQVPSMCGQLLALYAGEQYKERFAWIDRLQLVRDTGLRAALDDRLGRELAAGKTEHMHLAPPEALDWQNVSGFYYWNPNRSERHDDLDIDQAVKVLRDHSQGPLTAEFLRRHHIYVEFRENLPVAKYTIYSALVFETEKDGRLYVLSDGDWHEIELNWANTIRAEVAGIDVANVELPEAREGENEKDYNVRAAAELGAHLFDRCLVRSGPSREPVEFCDILTGERQLVHVKRKIQSATLSHLFMQGHNSAQLLAYDSEFRSELVKAAEKAGLDIAIGDGGIVPSEWEVVFAIVAKPSLAWPLSLPFFSQLSLVQTAKALRRIGYRYSLALVPVGPAQ